VWSTKEPTQQRLWGLWGSIDGKKHGDILIKIMRLILIVGVIIVGVGSLQYEGHVESLQYQDHSNIVSQSRNLRFSQVYATGLEEEAEDAQDKFDKADETAMETLASAEDLTEKAEIIGDKADDALDDFKDSADETKDLLESATGLNADAKMLEEESEEAEEEADEAREEADNAREEALKLNAELAKERAEQQKKIEGTSSIPVKETPSVKCAVGGIHVNSITSAGDGKVKVAGTYVECTSISKKSFDVDMDLNPEKGFFKFQEGEEEENEENDDDDETEDEEPRSPEEIASLFVAELIRKVGQSQTDFDDTNEMDANLAFSDESWSELLKLLKRFASEEDIHGFDMQHTTKFDNYDMDSPLSHLSSLFDGDVHSIRSKTMGKARLQVMTMRNDVSFDQSSTSGASFEVVLKHNELIRRTKCSPGHGRSDETGECMKCEGETYSSDGVRCEECEGEGNKPNKDKTSCRCVAGYEMGENGQCIKCDIEAGRFSSNGENCLLCDHEGGVVSEDGSKCNCHTGFENDPETGVCEASENSATGAAATGGGEGGDGDEMEEDNDEAEEEEEEIPSSIDAMDPSDLENMSEDELESMFSNLAF